ncbi:uncharacterized protein GLRG_09145 [Colletotrichum graminicola M1.001]|uniref:Uncharacterized protein n=1 Tax=Colletotrichum graminicola (strain M1.001 / M2 / FGSC 10212) TaxID=645133 RepID=E3QT13_COLGM|nr:uncharacterized protein GLRG_09145 [Colletotrichum graminicola M1.001]EFQ34001.1 hypothetical protein GLRG_09145 [Colletotrichum graminicola M1.001]
MHHNMVFKVEMTNKSDDAPNLVAARIADKAYSQNRFLGADGSAVSKRGCG